MCLNPTIILNPAYSQHRHEFQYLSLDGKFIPQRPLGDGNYYPVDLPSFASLDLSSTYDRFFAIDPDGLITKIFMPVPCNKCMECIESKQSAIRVRMHLERMSHDSTPLFFTLTYNNEHLPADGVSMTDVKRFLNRMHLYLGRAGRPTYFRHVVFSEYGSLNGRPHYHGIFYGIDWIVNDSDRIEFFNILEKAWGKGFVRYEPVTDNAFKYVSKYVGKDAFMNESRGRNPNFWTASRRDGGLGSQICNDESFLELCSTPQFPTVNLPAPSTEKGFVTVTLPSYIRNKILPPLSKYIPKRVRDAYLTLKKDLILARMASESLFDNLEHVPFDLCYYETSKLRTRDPFEDPLIYKTYSIPQCPVYSYGWSHEARLDFDNTYHDLLDTNLFDLLRKYDSVLGHYYGCDDLYFEYFREVPKYTDFVALKHRILSNAFILFENAPNFLLIFSQLHVRDRVSARFSERVEKYQSQLAPVHERSRSLESKNCKEYINRFMDGQ